MIRVFGATDTTFTSNGDYVLKAGKAKMRKVENGEWYVDIEAGHWAAEWLQTGNIVTASGPQGDQPFRIRNVQRTKNKIICRAWHVSFDADNFAIADPGFDGHGEDCQDALDKINAAAMPASIFTLTTSLDTAAYPNCKDCSLSEAISSIAETYQINHVERDGWTITLYYHWTAPDSGITIRYGKNLKDITCDEKWDEVVTRIYPTGKDGVRLDALDPTAAVYIDSDTQYDTPFCRHVSFQQDIDESQYATHAFYLQDLVDDLRAQAKNYLAEHCVPAISYSMSAIPEGLLDVGDLVQVEHEPLGIQITASVTAFEWDCILGAYTNIEFGNYQNTMRGYDARMRDTITREADNRINASMNKGGAIAGAIRTSGYYSNNELGAVGGAQVSGQMKYGATQIDFTVQMPKAPDGLSMVLTELRCNIIDSMGVYVLGSYVPGGYDVRADRTIGTNLEECGGTLVNVDMIKPEGFAGTDGLLAVRVEAIAIRFEEVIA